MWRHIRLSVKHLYYQSASVPQAVAGAQHGLNLAPLPGMSPSASRFRVAVVLGTRPEAIKMAPVIRALQQRADLFDVVVIATSQQREMLVQAMAAMGIRPDVDLGLTHANRTLAEFTAQAMFSLTQCFADLKPELLLVQGDTSTVEPGS